MNIHWSEWTPWADRGKVPGDPGVHVISKSGEIIYIGKTWGADGLRVRLAAFHRSASSGLKGHAGGLTFNGHFIVVDESQLAVRVHVPIIVRRDAEVLYPYVQYVERRLIWEHVEKFGRLPACNSE
jgi:hypothetical protein